MTIYSKLKKARKCLPHISIFRKNINLFILNKLYLGDITYVFEDILVVSITNLLTNLRR